MYYRDSRDDLTLHWTISDYNYIDESLWRNEYNGQNMRDFDQVEIEGYPIEDNQRGIRVLSETYAVVALHYLEKYKRDTRENRNALIALDTQHIALMTSKLFYQEQVLNRIKTNLFNLSFLNYDELSLMNPYSKHIDALIKLLNEMKAELNKNQSIIESDKVQAIKILKQLVKEAKYYRDNKSILNLVDDTSRRRILVSILARTLRVINSYKTVFNSQKYEEIAIIIANNITILCFDFSSHIFNDGYKAFLEHFDSITSEEQDLIQKKMIYLGDKRYHITLSISDELSTFISILTESECINLDLMYGISCFALMTFNSKQYVAFSGDDLTYLYEKNLLIKLRRAGFEKVKRDDQMLYYFNDKGVMKSINFGDASLLDLEDAFVNKLYSCCERKLLRQLSTHSSQAKMIVKYMPCLKCDRALFVFSNVDVDYLMALTVSQFYNDKNKFIDNLEKRITSDQDDQKMIAKAIASATY